MTRGNTQNILTLSILTDVVLNRLPRTDVALYAYAAPDGSTSRPSNHHVFSDY